MDNYNFNYVRVTKYDGGYIEVELCSTHDSMDEVKRAINKDIFYENALSNGRPFYKGEDVLAYLKKAEI